MIVNKLVSFKEVQDGGRYHIETSPFICSVNQWTGFHMITVPVMKELGKFQFEHESSSLSKKILLRFPIKNKLFQNKAAMQVYYQKNISKVVFTILNTIIHILISVQD